MSDRPRSALKLTGKRAFFALLRTAVAAVLPIGTRNAEYWAHYFGHRFPAFLVPYAVDNAHFTAGAADRSGDEALRRSLELDPERPVVLFASKLQTRKHCDDLLEAYLALIGSMPVAEQPHLLIVGDGEEMPTLRQRVTQAGASLVRFAGFRNQTELPAIFALSTVFVLPSRHEAWGLIVNEAMACGLPVIVSDEVGCAVDLVHSGENGFIVPVRDVPALTAALQRVLAPGEAQRMGRSSRERIAKWSFAEDLNGLKAALAFVTRRPVSGSVAAADTHADATNRAPGAGAAHAARAL